MARLGLERCDAILAYSPSIAAAYRTRLGLAPTAVTVVHEAADTALFRPLPPDPGRSLDDALFVGNWGGSDRAAELRTFLLRPARRHRADRRFALYGVRYPPEVLRLVVERCGIDHRGWLPNHRVPEAFAQSRTVLHVPRRQYVEALSGTPTIRVFEALACGAALLSTPWQDTDRLFRAGEDYVVTETAAQQEAVLEWLWRDEAARQRLGRSGRARILAQHTCRHRAEQLLAIIARLRGDPAPDRRTTGDAVAASCHRMEDATEAAAAPGQVIRAASRSTRGSPTATPHSEADADGTVGTERTVEGESARRTT
jgi:spore maturation protein CgeB